MIDGNGRTAAADALPRQAEDTLQQLMMADAYVSTITKARRRGRILIDYLRNQRGMTAVAAYSTRARPGAAVSMPVAWEELDQIGPAYFTVTNTPARLDDLAHDPWKDFRTAARPLEGKARRSKA